MVQGLKYVTEAVSLRRKLVLILSIWYMYSVTAFLYPLERLTHCLFVKNSRPIRVRDQY